MGLFSKISKVVQRDKESSIACLRCGQCCCYPDPKDKTKVKRCKYLIVFPSTTMCRIYNSRMGVMIDEGVFCGSRSEIGAFNFVNCPYNVIHAGKEVKDWRGVVR